MSRRTAISAGGAGWALMCLTLCMGTPSDATPVYALRSVNACDTCHIEPLGWHNPDVAERRCSLDCSVCHVSPTGGGMRTAAGYYYGREVLPTWGERPSSHADPEQYREEGAPTEGRYRAFEGFSGWWPGTTWHGDIPERYGDIEPDPAFKVGGDGRLMVYAPIDGRDVSVFPMQASLYAYLRASYHWSAYTSTGLYSSRSNLDVTSSDPRAAAAVIDYIAVRELFVKADRLPHKAYVRAGRFAPAYGWRIPDHTTFTRRNLGFDNDRGVYGVEAGINPNYPYANVSVFYQGLDAWPGDIGDEAVGGSLTAGVRELGWSAGGNLHALARPGGSLDLLAGPQWGANLYPFTYLGEVDIRSSTTSGVVRRSAFAMHELDWLLSRGISAKIKYDWMDTDISLADDHLHRVALGTEWHPIRQSHVELQYRINLSGGGAAFAGSAGAGQEVILMTHGWF